MADKKTTLAKRSESAVLHAALDALRAEKERLAARYDGRITAVERALAEVSPAQAGRRAQRKRRPQKRRR